MGNSRVWLFRGLVIAAAGLMVVSWLLPWWIASALIGDVRIYPYGLRNTLGQYAVFIEGAEMPVWFAPLMWIYLGVCIVALLYSLLAKEKAVSLGKFKLSLPQVIIGGVGLSYLVVAVLAVIVAAIRSGDFGMILLGTTRLFEHPPVDVEASLRFGYWLACGVGPLCVILALLRDRIIGKPS